LEDGAVQYVDLEEKISPMQLYTNCPDSMFYSLLVQSGYLSLEDWDESKGVVAIPNVELKEVWRRFLLSNFFKKLSDIDYLLPNLDDAEEFAAGFQTFLTPIIESLSYNDLPKKKYSDGKYRTPEIHYHMLLAGILFSYKKDFGYETIRSNRESGDGRFDILMDFKERAILFEIKSAAADEDLEAIADIALNQIQKMRYGADLEKPVIAIGCAFCGKRCGIAGAEI
jgi:hypothetical protein